MPESTVRTFDRGMLTGLVLVAAVLVVNAAVAYRNVHQLNEDAHWVAHTHVVLELTGDVLLTLVDAETGQRGFLLTGKDSFLKPYDDARADLAGRLKRLKEETGDNTHQQARIADLERKAGALMEDLKEGIARRRQGVDRKQEAESAKKVKKQLDAIRKLAADMRREEGELLEESEGRSHDAYNLAVTTGLLTALLGLVMVGAFALLLDRGLRSRQRAAAALHEQREWLHTTLASIGDAVIATDTAGRITFLNRVAEALTGWKEDEARGRPLDDVFRIVNEQTRQAAANPVLRALREGQAVGLANHTLLVAKDGSEHPIDDSAAPIRDRLGQVSGVVLVFRDVTERRRAEEALREADRRKDEFLATLAHELRNPLAPLSNALEVLRLEGSGAFAEMRAMMARQLTQLMRLVDDLLDVNRISQGKVELRKERLELRRVLESALETSRPRIEAARHQLAVELPPRPLWVEGDPMRLAQVVANLLNNAAKYTPEGGHVWLSTSSEDGLAVIRVRDDGMGIPAEMLPRIFDMFAQADRALRRAQGGLGIGLTLVRRLVEMHGGSVEAHSAGPGKGSEFVVRLPLAPAILDSGGAGERVPEATAGPRPRRILIVDDNRDASDSLALLLRLLGNEVRTARDGPSALEAAREYRPELVLLDIGLPGMSGYEVAQRMRQMPEVKDAVLVAQTGWSQEEDRLRSRAAGFDHHLVKPVEPAALQRVLETP